MTRNLHYSDLMMIGELWYDRTPCAPCDSPSDKRKHGRNGEKQRDKRNRKAPIGGKGRKNGETKWGKGKKETRLSVK